MNRKINSIIAISAATMAITASAAGVAGASSETPKSRTCAAVKAWENHRTTANLDAIMVNSFRVKWEWLGVDADQLYQDVRGGIAKDVKQDLGYLRSDCK